MNESAKSRGDNRPYTPFAFILRAALILLAGYAALQVLPLKMKPQGQDQASEAAKEVEAATRMRRAMQLLADEREARGYPVDPVSDPNRSGLIGLPWSGLTTTLGSLPAKRSSAQPASAVLLRRMLKEAGVGPGDAVAVDSSGSFPGFAIATVIAAESLGAECILIASIGSSTWGANVPDFTIADMIEFLHSEGLFAHGLAGISAGGADDSGSDMDGPSLERALARATAGGARLIQEPEIGRSIEARFDIFNLHAAGRTLAAFVSAGANYPSTGGVEIGNGILSGSAQGQGMVQHFLARGIPVIRLLDVKDLCTSTGLPWDPFPWPADPGMPPDADPRVAAIRRLIAGLSLILAVLSLVAGRKKILTEPGA